MHLELARQRICASGAEHRKKKLDLMVWEIGGDGGIRTLGTLLGYAHLANECLQPLGHVSEARTLDRVYARAMMI
jgi:hypothetical protein